MSKTKILRIGFPLATFMFSTLSLFQCKTPEKRSLPEGSIPISGPGNYDKAGPAYMLTDDIVSGKSAVFLGKDITLDLNGYTITYAGGNYGHIPNSGFEEGVGDRGQRLSIQQMYTHSSAKRL
ncbi:hypothetical protein MNBD_BACTEROID01-520 [hydrothermal vent metagenome]|uniref:Uncharacterized protein n=1 Tax=hydrothermal vent metagenome TaxID=652676 RepID=A0A3B0U0F8_9ZZZZ